MSSDVTKSVAGTSAPRPIAVERASWPICAKSGDDLGRRMLNGSEGRQQRLFVAGIELNVVARRCTGVETDRVGDDKRDGLCLRLADGLRRRGASIAAV